MKVTEIISAIELFAAPELQEDYDNAGLITGNSSWECTGALCTLDVTLDVIREAKDRLGDVTAAVEFRSTSWFNEKNVERTLRFLEDLDMPLVMVDGPQGFKSSVPPIAATTSSKLAVVRFHGRRTDTWEAKGIPTVERFRYLYEKDELEEWVPRIRQAAAQAKDTHVLMNNCYANYGSTNARELAALLLEPEEA